MKAIPPPEVICNTHGRHTKRYKVGRHLGSGGFANVYSVESVDSHRVYACKVINKIRLRRKEHQRKLVSEIKLHRTLCHHHVCKFFNQFDDDHNVYILLEICENQSLMELSNTRKVLTDDEVRYFLKQIICGLKYLHNKSIIHRDLKLGNILLDKDLIVKLCDFGLATKVIDDERKTTICGTPNYIAPEILNQNKLGHGHSFEVDIWSLGVIIFTLLAGRPPFCFPLFFVFTKFSFFRCPSRCRLISCFRLTLCAGSKREICTKHTVESKRCDTNGHRHIPSLQWPAISFPKSSPNPLNDSISLKSNITTFSPKRPFRNISRSPSCTLHRLTTPFSMRQNLALHLAANPKH